MTSSPASPSTALSDAGQVPFHRDDEAVVVDISAELIRLWDLASPSALVFTRISGLLLTAPILGDLRIPWQTKALLSLALTVVMAPLVATGATPGIANGCWYALALGRELVVGLAIGFVMQIFFQVARFGGDLIGRTAGFAAAEMFDPEAETMVGPVGDLFFLSLCLLFLATNGHHHLFAALARSFTMVPLGAAELGAGLTGACAHAADAVFHLGVALSLPVLGCLTAVTVAESVVARAVPQVNILNFTFVTKILLALVLLHLGAPAAIAFFGLVLVQGQEATFALLPLLAPG